LFRRPFPSRSLHLQVRVMRPALPIASPQRGRLVPRLISDFFLLSTLAHSTRAFSLRSGRPLPRVPAASGQSIRAAYLSALPPAPRSLARSTASSCSLSARLGRVTLLRGGGASSVRMVQTGAAAGTTTLETLGFDNSFVRDLPGDALSQTDRVKANVPRQVENALYSLVQPTPVANPSLVAFSKECAGILDLSEEECSRLAFTEAFAGNTVLPGSEPYAACYGGHQFGNWAGQLGDGRAMSLGEVVNEKGERWELQLKGAGPTPYSRTADGRAVLRSSVREFLCSEAMFHLGVPTTRALSLCQTGDAVVRDVMYDGNARPEPGAVVCRVAPSFIRFGNFELLASRGDLKRLASLARYTLDRHFPEIEIPDDGSLKKAIPEMIAKVCETTAEMVAAWQRVGFVHGVMNTDNMSILGITIDYGPYGWVDNFDRKWTPNTTDNRNKRYCFYNQPGIAVWNLVRLANALLPLVEGDAKPLEEALGAFEKTYLALEARDRAGKLGFVEWRGGKGEKEGEDAKGDAKLWEDLEDLLEKWETDYTIFFRQLGHVTTTPDADVYAHLDTTLARAFYTPPTPGQREIWASWLTKYIERVREDGGEDGERKARMETANPKYVLRNYLAQEAIDQAEAGDNSGVQELLEVMRNPYAEQPGFEERYYQRRPEWARKKVGCSALSCSS